MIERYTNFKTTQDTDAQDEVPDQDTTPIPSQYSAHPFPAGGPTDEQLEALQTKIGEFKKSLETQEETHEVAD